MLTQNVRGYVDMITKRCSKQRPLISYLIPKKYETRSAKWAITTLVANVRREQIQQISSHNQEQEDNDAGKTATQILALSVVSMSLAGVGALGYPLLSWCSLLGVLYISRYAFVDSLNVLMKERKVDVDMLSTITRVMLIATGNFFFAAWGILNYAFNRKLLTVIKSDSKKSLIDVFRQRPRSVWVLTDGLEIEIPFENLKSGDIVVVDAGGVVPVDGFITEGAASIDQHVLTGESQPVEKEIGDQVLALTVVLAGRICVRVEKTGEETTAAQIAHIYNQTADIKLDMQLKVETMSNRTITPTLILSGLCLPILGSTQAIGILAGHFKYKGTIVSSVAILNILNLVSKKGILVKDGRTFELLNQVDTVVFDKTGTLTREEPYVGFIYTCDGYSEDEVLSHAATAEIKQTHPIAKAILKEADRKAINIPEIDEAEYAVGFGIKVEVDSRCIYVGSGRFMEMEKLAIPANLLQTQTNSHNQGYSLVFVAINDQVVGAIELHPTLRTGAETIVKALKKHGIQQTYIISGDHETPTKKLAQEIGIDHYFAEALPERKAELIERLQREGKKVCYVGDGINDAIALKKATVSISLSGATTVAIDTAQVILMDENLNHLCYLFDISKQLDTNIKRTFALVLGSSIVTMGGALFLHFGLATAYILPQLGLLAGIANSMWPLLQHRHDVANKKQGNQAIGHIAPQVPIVPVLSSVSKP
ncbi:MAG: heavy metal translocating P-type ATPase [Chloroflexota bacterium]